MIILMKHTMAYLIHESDLGNKEALNLINELSLMNIEDKNQYFKLTDKT